MATSLRTTGAPSRGPLYDYLAPLRGINYYATWGSWDSFWLNYDHAKIAADYARIASWGFNMVRLITRTSTFGYPTPDPAYTALLEDAIATAAAAGLRCQLTLFDGAPHGFDADVPGSQTWCAAIVAPYASDPRIAFWELQNEVNTTDTTRLGWAAAMLPFLRTQAGATPITISATGSSGLPAENHLKTMVSTFTPPNSEPPDFYSMHIYLTNQPMVAYQHMQNGIAAVSPRPLIIGETGQTTYAGSNYWPTPFGGTPNPATTELYEAWQDFYYRTIFYAARALGLPCPMPWLPFDLDPAHMQGGPTTTPSEWAFGLARTDGTPKPALATIQDYLNHQRVSLENNYSFTRTVPDGRGGQWPSYWATYSPDLGNPYYDPDTSHNPDGSGSVATASSIDSTRAVCTWLADPIRPIITGQRYALGAWVKGAGVTGTNDIAIAWFDNNYNFKSLAGSANAPSGDFDWTYLTATVRAPAGAQRADINLRSRANDGTIWFDDISFEPIT